MGSGTSVKEVKRTSLQRSGQPKGKKAKVQKLRWAGTKSVRMDDRLTTNSPAHHTRGEPVTEGPKPIGKEIVKGGGVEKTRVPVGGLAIPIP